MEFKRQPSHTVPPLERIKNYNEFHALLPEAERKKQAGRCMECGVPFCQAGVNYGTGFSGCPLHNLIPEWNDMVYKLFDEFNRRMEKNINEYLNMYVMNNYAVKEYQN